MALDSFDGVRYEAAGLHESGRLTKVTLYGRTNSVRTKATALAVWNEDRRRYEIEHLRNGQIAYARTFSEAVRTVKAWE